MFFKERIESRELLTLRALSPRMTLSSEVHQHYLNLEKGFEGEVKFDKLIEPLSNEWIIVNDLFLRNNNTNFQIDSTLISYDVIFLFDVKNFEGDYYIEGNNWYSTSNKVVNNPLIQLERIESLFRRLLQDMGMSFTIESYLVFINPQFTLYNAPMTKSIIFPTQLNRLLKRLSMKKPKTKERHLNFAKLLVSEHITDPPFTNVPEYSFEKLDKGVFCPVCRKPMNRPPRSRSLVCTSCSYTENIDEAVLRSVEEFRLLFPEKRITTNEVFEWCNGVIDSKKTLRRVLRKNYERVGHTHNIYYV